MARQCARLALALQGLNRYNDKKMAERPNPEEILSQVQKEERAELSGKLKVFLGAAPGVGKTFSMLEAARLKQEEGLDVVVGVVETHGREETQERLAGLETLPRRKIFYHNVELHEFDLDAAISRAPALILVDELAHTNAPGSRHIKRWQDVQELLACGIDVYTTVNIGHLESLNDIVSQVTGVTIRETIPDSIIEKASSVELVDLPPEELIERLKDGKVYLSEQARIAEKNFFKIGNLTALRELALRMTAERVNAQVQARRGKEPDEKTWPTTEKLLVCVGPGPGSAKLVRTAKRMAAAFQAEWTAVFVDSARRVSSLAARNAAIDNLRLAEKLGAETITLTGMNVAEEIVSFARSKNMTKIIIGKNPRRSFKDYWKGPNLLDEVIRTSGEIEVCAVMGSSGVLAHPAALPSREKLSLVNYGLAFGIFLLCTGMSFLVYSRLSLINIVMIYLLGTVVVASRGDRWVSVWMSVLSVLAFDFFFVAPRFDFAVSDGQYILTFGIFLAVSLLISYLSVAIRRQAEIAQINERRSAALHGLSRRLTVAIGTENILAVAVPYLAEVFDGAVAVFLPDQKGNVVLNEWIPKAENIDSKELTIAQWAYDIGQAAGFGTQTLPFLDAIYLPLKGANALVGTLRLKPKEKNRLLIPEQLYLAEAFSNQIALALEVYRLQETTRQSQIEVESEKMRNSLLSSVSHDLRTPLAAIIGSASTLLEQDSFADVKEAKELIKNIYDSGLGLSRLVANLLHATQLEAGAIPLNLKKVSLEEILESAIHKLGAVLAGKALNMSIPGDFPLIPVDDVLFEQVFINLFDNAAKYSPADSPLDISAIVEGRECLVQIADRGPGLDPQEAEQIFDKFYRGAQAKQKMGTGLGLTICRAIVKAHGGKIWVENREGGGSAFKILIPLDASHA